MLVIKEINESVCTIGLTRGVIILEYSSMYLFSRVCGDSVDYQKK